MKVNKYSKTLHLKLEESDLKEMETFEIYHIDDFFWNDLSICRSGEDGWLYLYDANEDKVYKLNDYGFNRLEELKAGKRIILPAYDNNEDYEDYEWNQS